MQRLAPSCDRPGANLALGRGGARPATPELAGRVDRIERFSALHEVRAASPESAEAAPIQIHAHSNVDVFSPPNLVLLATGTVLACIVMLAVWRRQTRTQDATPVDVAWAALLGALAILYALFAEGLPARRFLVAILVVLATGRLAWHLYLDRTVERAEDGRYRTLRERWGRHAQRNFFWFFQGQALLAAVLSLPFLLACASPAELSPLDLGAAALGVLALLGETVADRQLARFRADERHRGRTCRVGLWRFSRHPNYFFQWLLWCAYALLASSAPLGWIGVASPLLMLFLILRVTGIPPTEAQALRSRGDDYREYQRTTSAFVPWFPRGSIP